MAKENIFKRFKAFLGEVRNELKKVTWPTRPDLQKTTIAVLVASVVFGVYLFVADFVFFRFFEFVKGLFR